MLYAKAHQRQDAEICDIVGSLARLMRSRLTNGDQALASLREELDCAKSYLDLQKQRFGDLLEWSVEVEDPELLDLPIPRLCLQPLVENSLVHGLEPKRGGGRVDVAVWEEDAGICIRVKDDGLGFPEDSPETGRSAVKAAGGEAPRHNAIALKNLARRMELLYGGRARLDIKSVAGKGAEVSLLIPKEAPHAARTDC